jgi:hypothetical protein
LTICKPLIRSAAQVGDLVDGALPPRVGQRAPVCSSTP